MGTNGSRILEIDNIEDWLAQCQPISQFGTSSHNPECPVYGPVEYVSFQNMQFCLGRSQDATLAPHRSSLHYLIRPDYVLFPTFTLLQSICPNDYSELLSIIKGISQMVIDGGPVGIGYGRVAYNARWGVVGQKDEFWAYSQVLYQRNFDGVYLSPQLVTALSQNIQNPNVDFEKADMFALGLMIVELIFQEKLDEIYDYENFNIYLNPLLQKIALIKENFGEEFAQVLISMLEIEEVNRINFSELLDQVEFLMSKCSRNMLGSNNNQRNMEYNRGNKTPTKINNSIYSQKSPRAAQGGTYRNDVSPFRGRFGSNVRPSKTPERQNRSPLRRDMKINTRFDRENTVYSRPAFTDNGRMPGQRQNLSPLMRR